MAEETTRARIERAAREEFLDLGFQRASLRSIVKAAGVTTGAFYGYYDSKAALFRALVGPVHDHVRETYRISLDRFASLPLTEQPEHMGQAGLDCMRELLPYLCAHRDEVRLLLCCAEGTRYAHFVDELVAWEVEATHQYYDVLAQLGRPVPPIDPRLEHILATGMFDACFELILHDVPDPETYLEDLNAFYTAGWQRIMGQ